MSADNSVCIVETAEGFLVEELGSEFWDLCDPLKHMTQDEYVKRIGKLFADCIKYPSRDVAVYAATEYIEEVGKWGRYVEYGITLLPKTGDAPPVSG